LNVHESCAIQPVSAPDPEGAYAKSREPTPL
jgi:hypothetical protein